MTRLARASFFLSSLVLALVAGCECSPPAGRSCDTASDCRRGERCVDGVCEVAPDATAEPGDSSTGFPDTGPPRVVTGVRVDPASADLLAADGATPTQSFTAYLTYDDGSETPAFGPRFALENRSIGDLDVASGLFTANGTIGGTSSVVVTVPDPRGGADLVGMATLRVRLERTIDPAGDGATRFGGATEVDDAARVAGVVYPLDGVVMPQNVYPADVQWTNGAAGDLFRVRMTKPDVTVSAYVSFDGMNHWLVDATAWRSLAQTNPDDPAQLVVDRLEAASGQVVRGTPLSMTFARAALTGSVYYWDIEAGRIQRIDDGSGAAVSFMPNPPQGCVGCHSVSPTTGRYMAGRFGGGENYGSVMDLTTDLTPNPTPTLWSTSYRTWWFSAWSPDETRLVTVYRDDLASRQLQIIDPFTGNIVPITGTLPSGTHPAWSPDGAHIAYVTNTNAWGGGNTTGDIAVVPFAADSVGAQAVIHTGTSISGGRADSYPSWSPDSMRIAFANGSGSRSESDTALLYIMGPDGSAVTQLARASSPDRIDYQPRFSPFVSGAPPQYYWMSFLSRRVYGNPQIGNSPRPVSRRQQIWVTAIRVGAAAGEDPSSVPYWLPGQNPRSANISAFWAPRPCRPDGEGCSVGSECCGGECVPPAGGGAPVCSPPPPERCRVSGETCSTDGDCCPDMGLSCIGHVCVAGPG